MRKMILTLFVVASAFALEHPGECVAMGGDWTRDLAFFKSLCPTRTALNRGIEFYLDQTNQTNRPYVIVEQEHWYLLHFTD